MAHEIHVQGYEQYKKAEEENKGKTVFALFCGTKDPSGNSWCPDCVTAEPVIADKLPSAPKDAVMIHCGVGDRTFWKDKDNVFRKDPQLMLKGVPTLLKVGSREKLVEAQCANGGLVEAFFTDDL